MKNEKGIYIWAYKRKTKIKEMMCSALTEKEALRISPEEASIDGKSYRRYGLIKFEPVN